MNILWHNTRDLHHACEAHPVGAAMASGTPPIEWYTAWIQALRQIHAVVDLSIPLSLGRVSKLDQDLEALESSIKPIEAADAYTSTLTNDLAIAGAGYVLTGAHLMGGEIMRRRLQDYPTHHLEWDDRKVGLVGLQQLRDTPNITEQARACFSALLSCMDEIQARFPQPNTPKD